MSAKRWGNFDVVRVFTERTNLQTRQDATMAISLMKLPYALDALEPHVSAATLKQHHGAHHKGYVDKVNKAVAGSDMAEMALEQIVAAARKSGDTALFNSAAQTWNHGFYWHSLSPDRTKPSNDLAGAIRRVMVNR